MTASTITPPRHRAGGSSDASASTGSSKRRFPVSGQRLSLFALLTGTAVLYLWNLGASGWANEFYAAAVQAGTQSWKALLFGSLDAGNAITVDKPPAALWVMALSGRIFGFSSWSLLAPQALMGVAAVAVLYAAVKRVGGHGAGLLAGVVLTATPVAALMFRFDNPDALLVLLLVIGGYCVTRATENGSGRWLSAAGVAIGFGFLTKLLQAFLVLPAFGLVFLIAAPIGLGKRIGKLVVACVSMAISGGWLLVLVALWPAGSRPYIGGSTDNSLLQLALGYNGLGRVFGGEGNGGGGGNTGFGGATGITRLFGQSMGVEISWLLPVALIGLVAGLWFTRRTARTAAVRANLLLWGGWLAVTGVVFSYMEGTIHPYYTVALAPAVAALIGISVRELWIGRQYLSARVVLAMMAAVTGVWNFILLDRTPDWLPWLRWTLLVGAILVAAVLVVGGHQLKKFTVVLVSAGLLFGLGGSAAYAVATAAAPHSGSIPSSGPGTSQTSGGPGGGGMSVGVRGGPGGVPGGRSTGDNSSLYSLLKASIGYRWAAATVGAQSAGGLALNTGASVLPIGGFTGSDNAPTLTQFQQYVGSGQVRYFIVAAAGMGGPGHDADSAGSQITAWVKAHFTATEVGDATVYDLSAPLR